MTRTEYKLNSKKRGLGTDSDRCLSMNERFCIDHSDTHERNEIVYKIVNMLGKTRKKILSRHARRYIILVWKKKSTVVRTVLFAPTCTITWRRLKSLCT